MQTIVEPKQHIDKLWGKQRVRENETYRLMKYVLRVDHEGKVLLHNVVTGQLVALDSDEADVVNQLPQSYTSVMERLVTGHFLVPVVYDEYQQVVNLRRIINSIEDNRGETSITHYTIFPTTACNARCYYCFEHGVEPVTMSTRTIEELVEFINSHCGGKRTVQITWFGGEPTVASRVIDQVCEGLANKGVHYFSRMLTNGYLFDEAMVEKARALWNLRSLQICVDGTERSYNRIKSYVSAKDNPYQRVMRNIGLLLKSGISVTLRMNFDLGNYQEFANLVQEVRMRFGANRLLRITTHPIIGEFVNQDGIVEHADDQWFATKQVELFNVACKHGYALTLRELPFLNGDACSAYSNRSVAIRADGGICRCAELFSDEDLTGTLEEGIRNNRLIRSWKEIADYSMCTECSLFPYCVRLKNCPNKSYCHKPMLYRRQFEETISTMRDRNNNIMTERRR